jgi:phage shock protein A
MKTIINKEKKVARLQKKEDRLVKKGNKAVDEGRERKADRILGRAARVENRKIKTSEKMKSGGTIKKAEDGVTTGKQNRLARQEKRVYNRYTDAKASGNTKKSGRLYDKLIDKQTKSINAGVNVQYKSGGKMTKSKK